MILSGPNLVGGSLTDLVIPIRGDHGPFEYGGRLFAACKTNDTNGGTVLTGAAYFYSATSPSGPSFWTRETTGYPSGASYIFNYCAPDFNKDTGIATCLVEDAATGNLGIGQFDCGSRTYGPVTPFSHLLLSTVLPILIRHMPDGTTIVAGYNGSGTVFYRFGVDGTASAAVSIFGGSHPVAIVDDRVSNVAHIMFRGDPGSSSAYYAKIFSDNTVSIVSSVGTGLLYNNIGAEGATNYSKSYEYFAGKMFVQARGSSVDVIVSDVLTNADEPQVFTILPGISNPTSVPSGFSQLDCGNLTKIEGLNKLYLAVPNLQYDGGGAVTQDQILVSEYTGDGFTTPTVGADFLTSPPTIPPPGTIPAPGDEYSHFHSIHGLDDGTLGTLCDFFVNDGEASFCTTYYTNFSTGGGGQDYLVAVSDTLQFNWNDRTEFAFPQLSYSFVDSLSLDDSLFYSIDGNPKAAEADTLNLTDHVGIGVSSISNGGGGTGGTGESGGFPGGGPTNHPGYCIFEFYEMMSPENVETLPVPKRYDQLGPMRFDKIAKVFGFRIRLIMNGNTTVMPYRIFGDDSPTAAPGYSTPLFSDSFNVRPGIDNTYEIQLPKSINTDILRLELGPTTDTFHRYDVLMKIQTSGMQGQSKWLPIR